MSAPMRLGFDATPLFGARTGVGVMTARVLERLAARDDIDVVAYATTWRQRGRLATLVDSRVTSVSRPMPARPLHLAWRHSEQPPIELFTGRLDLVHGPNFIVPPARRAGRVVTVHDLTSVHHPELCTRHTRTYPAALRRALRGGVWVHTVSDFVRDEILEHFDADPERVVTIPNGVDAISAADPAEGHRIVGTTSYLLAIGTIEPRKNFPALVRAFDAVAQRIPETYLAIVGPDGWGVDAFEMTLAAAKHRDRIVRIGMVDEPARAALLRGATALVYPSTYEGFGLPPLEAMSVGAPVLATASGAVSEVVGDDALLVPVGDDEALAEGLVRIATDDSLRSALAERGPARATQYDWSRTVDGLVALYKRAQLGS